MPAVWSVCGVLCSARITIPASLTSEFIKQITSSSSPSRVPELSLVVFVLRTAHSFWKFSCSNISAGLFCS